MMTKTDKNLISQRLKSKERVHERCIKTYENYQKLWRDHNEHVEKHFDKKKTVENFTGEFKNEKVIKTEIESEV